MTERNPHRMTSERRTRTLSYLLILAAALLVTACNGNLPPPEYTAALTSPITGATGTGGANLTSDDEIGVFGTYADLSSDETSTWLTGQGPHLPFQLQQDDGGTNGEFIGNLTLSTDEVKALKNGELGLAVYTKNHPVGGPPELSGTLTPNQ